MIRPPQPPPEPVRGVPGPTYVAHDGHVWRRAMLTWETVDPPIAERLLAGFCADALNTADWFHARASELAHELERAMRDAGLILGEPA